MAYLVTSALFSLNDIRIDDSINTTKLILKPLLAGTVYKAQE